jgi:hypothetical protein
LYVRSCPRGWDKQAPPVLDYLDEAELLGWSVEIVRAAHRHGYLASTADAIAVFETSILLAGMRMRAKPTLPALPQRVPAGARGGAGPHRLRGGGGVERVRPAPRSRAAGRRVSGARQRFRNKK